MTLTLKDAESAWMSSDIRFEDYISGFDATWFGDIALTQVAIALQSMDDEQRAALKKMAPIQYEYYEKLFDLGGSHASTSSAANSNLVQETGDIPGYGPQAPNNNTPPGQRRLPGAVQAEPKLGAQ